VALVHTEVPFESAAAEVEDALLALAPAVGAYHAALLAQGLTEALAAELTLAAQRSLLRSCPSCGL
jgi:hypothetical protein